MLVNKACMRKSTLKLNVCEKKINNNIIIKRNAENKLMRYKHVLTAIANYGNSHIKYSL